MPQCPRKTLVVFAYPNFLSSSSSSLCLLLSRCLLCGWQNVRQGCHSFLERRLRVFAYPNFHHHQMSSSSCLSVVWLAKIGQGCHKVLERRWLSLPTQSFFLLLLFVFFFVVVGCVAGEMLGKDATVSLKDAQESLPTQTIIIIIIIMFVCCVAG